MDTIWIARVVYRHEFDKVVEEAAFSTKDLARGWIEVRYHEHVHLVERQYNRSVVTEIERVAFIM